MPSFRSEVRRRTTTQRKPSSVEGSPGVLPSPEGPKPELPSAPAPTLESVLADHRAVLVYSHMNPDPDTVGAALGIAHLLTEAYGKTVTVCYRGIVGRAENRELLRRLADRIMPAREVDQSRFDVAVLVDAQPGYGFVPELDRLPVAAVIDHHPLSPSSAKVPFTDIRPDYGSTSTIVTEYLREAGLDPGQDVATALFYGLKTDTCDLTRRTSAPDQTAYSWLLPRIDRRMLAAIENPPLTREYYEELTTAVGRALVYRNVVLTELGWMAYPDMVAEIADRLLRLEGMEWSVCFGAHDQRIYMSVRTNHPTKDAGILVKTVLRSDGVGGGHDTMAAGRIQLPDVTEATYLRIVSELWQRFLVALGERAGDGRRMVGSSRMPLRVPRGATD